MFKETAAKLHILASPFRLNEQWRSTCIRNWAVNVYMFRTQVYMSAYKYVSLLLFQYNMSYQKREIKCITPDPVHMSSSFTRPHPVHTRPPRSHITITITSRPFTCDHLIHTTTPRSHMTPFKHDQPVHTTTACFICDHLLHMRPSCSHDHIPFTRRRDHPIHTWPPHGHLICLYQNLSSCHIWTKSIKGFANMR